ncbi:MAG: hypothetical protein ACI3Y0_12145 [Prevotella sp.]
MLNFATSESRRSGFAALGRMYFLYGRVKDANAIACLRQTIAAV